MYFNLSILILLLTGSILLESELVIIGTYVILYLSCYYWKRYNEIDEKLNFRIQKFSYHMLISLIFSLSITNYFYEALIIDILTGIYCCSVTLLYILYEYYSQRKNWIKILNIALCLLLFGNSVLDDFIKF